MKSSKYIAVFCKTVLNESVIGDNLAGNVFFVFYPKYQRLNPVQCDLSRANSSLPGLFFRLGTQIL